MRRRAVVLSVMLALYTTGANAQARAEEPAAEPGASPAAQALYRGVVGNLLEAVPIDPENRAQLQRVTTVVSSPLSGHSLAVALGVASPPLMIIGFIWGLWSANQIQPTDAPANRARAGGQQDRQPGDPHFATSGASIQASGAGPRLTVTPRPAADPAAALESLMRRADASALSTVVGGASSTDRLVPCENCIMPMLYPRSAPDVR